MKKIYVLFLMSIFIASCSSDDNNDNNGNNNPSESFLPFSDGNYWVYDVQGSVVDGRDSLYVANDTVITGETYKKLKTKEQPIGFFSNALNNNGIRHSGGKIFLTGTAGLSFSEDLPFNVAVSNFVVFDQNASANQVLGTVTGSIEQEIQGFQIEFKYTLASKAKATLATHTSGQQTYSNIMPVEIILSLEIIAHTEFAGFPISYPVMQPQNVVTSTQYYAEGIGAVTTVTDIAYELEELPIPIELPIPTSGTEHQEEILVDYNVE